MTRSNSYGATVIQMAEDAELHLLQRTGSGQKKLDALIQFIRDSKRDDRREAARKARRAS